MHSPELAIPPFSIRTPQSPPRRPHALETESASARVYKDGIECLAHLSTQVDCPENKLIDLFKEACATARKGGLNGEFIFFAVHGDNVYKQPTDLRDFDVVQEQGVPVHVTRPDYKVHGTILKTHLPAMMAKDAIICNISKGDAVIATVASLADYGYQEAFSL